MIKTSITFFPLGNADTTLITLQNGAHILWDFAEMKNKDNEEDKRCDLNAELNSIVQNDFDVVTFTHGDRDHINGFSSYFYLDHAKKYQDGERKKIGVLWVPATILIDTQAEDEAKILKAEARHRLKNKQGILIFSKPSKMKKWCDDQLDISFDDVKHLFIDAGQKIPSYNLERDGVEFFLHAPFMSESQVVDRNGACIVVQVTINDLNQTKIILGADTTHEVWDDIVKITKYFEHDEKLEWDIFHISHHCSYLSLAPEKGKTITAPEDNIKWLYETQGNEGGKLISSSKRIPVKNSGEDEDNNPPHRQAANYYKEVVKSKNGEFIVTMSSPTADSPGLKTYSFESVDNLSQVEKKKVKNLRSIANGFSSGSVLSGTNGELNSEKGMSHQKHKFHA